MEYSFYVRTYRKKVRYFTAYNMLGKGGATVRNTKFSYFSDWLDLAGMKIKSAYIIQ